jgi:hypothetical protein
LILLHVQQLPLSQVHLLSEQHLNLLLLLLGAVLDAVLCGACSSSRTAVENTLSAYHAAVPQVCLQLHVLFDLSVPDLAVVARAVTWLTATPARRGKLSTDVC